MGQLEMTLPIDTWFVRHGQSEGNLAKRLSEAGDHAAYEEVYRGRHTRGFRLTDLGRKQADLTGAWLRSQNLHFDTFIVSDYARAIESAARLDLPDAQWRPNFYLTERDWGELDRCSEADREQRFAEHLRMQHVEPFFWAPDNGESMQRLCLRLDRGVLDTLHRQCSDHQAILVCHGEVMWGFRILLERMPQQEFKRLHLSSDPLDRLHNCEILHYTRRDPVSKRLSPHADWMRRIRPTESPVWISEWVEIKRPLYSNTDLSKILQGYPAVLQ